MANTAIDLSTFEQLVLRASQALAQGASAVEQRDQELERIKKDLEGGKTTGDTLLDLSVHTFGNDFKAQNQKLRTLRDLLLQHTGQYVMVRDTRLNYTSFLGYHSHPDIFKVVGVGILAQEPLTIGKGDPVGSYQWIDERLHKGLGDLYFLRLNFENGKYVFIRRPRLHETFPSDSEKEPQYKSIVKLREGSQEYDGNEFDMKERGIYRPYWKLSPHIFANIDTISSTETAIEFRLPDTIHPMCPQGLIFGMYVGNQTVLERLNIIGTPSLTQLHEIIQSTPEIVFNPK